MEKEDCLICLEIIDRQTGNYRVDVCNRCKYIIHIDCWEKFIEYQGKSKCLICNSLVDNETPISYTNRLIFHLSQPVNVHRQNIYNRFKLYFTIIVFVLVLSLIILSVMIISIS
jgi:hypothetical protein